jgi:hypothetical protein
MDIGRREGVAADEAMVNINADTIPVSVVVDAILLARRASRSF